MKYLTTDDPLEIARKNISRYPELRLEAFNLLAYLRSIEGEIQSLTSPDLDPEEEIRSAPSLPAPRRVSLSSLAGFPLRRRASPVVEESEPEPEAVPPELADPGEFAAYLPAPSREGNEIQPPNPPELPRPNRASILSRPEPRQRQARGAPPASLREIFRGLCQTNFAPREFRVLLAIISGRRMKPAQCASVTGISLGNVYRVLKKLRRDGRIFQDPKGFYSVSRVAASRMSDPAPRGSVSPGTPDGLEE